MRVGGLDGANNGVLQMGLLVDGVWRDQWYDTKSTGGKFVRKDAAFRNFVTADGSPGPTGEGGFKAEAGRYHLYVSLACPWAHRTLIFRKLKRLETLIGVSVVHPLMLENGWTFATDASGSHGDALFGSDFMHQIYTRADPAYTGRVTVPVLWDKETGAIVSNESSEIIRMFNSAFDAITGNTADYYPESLRSEIDAVNAAVYPNVNNGVYRAGFATAQDAYETAYGELFAELDQLEARLGSNRYLTGKSITEADWRLFTTLVRFDAVYVSHFKCNRNRIIDFPNLSGWLRELYQIDGVAETVSIAQIKTHYFASHETINPTRIVPAGPALDFDSPHGRDHLPAA
jgi:glutathionyl-hydroquinone reductase